MVEICPLQKEVVNKIAASCELDSHAKDMTTKLMRGNTILHDSIDRSDN